jgi:hypothetical protein
MRQSEQLQTVQESTAKLDDYLQDQPWSEWELVPIRGSVRWERTRQIVAPSKLIRANFSLVATSRAYECDDPGPEYVLDQGEGMVRRNLTVLHEQRALAERQHRNSWSLGATTLLKRGFQMQTEFADVPDLIPRNLTEQEEEAHINYGGSRKPQIVASENLNFNFVVSDWAPSDYQPEGAVIVQNLENGTTIRWTSHYLERDDCYVPNKIEQMERQYPNQLARSTALYLPSAQ